MTGSSEADTSTPTYRFVRYGALIVAIFVAVPICLFAFVTYLAIQREAAIQHFEGRGGAAIIRGSDIAETPEQSNSYYETIMRVIQGRESRVSVFSLKHGSVFDQTDLYNAGLLGPVLVVEVNGHGISDCQIDLLSRFQRIEGLVVSADFAGGDIRADLKWVKKIAGLNTISIVRISTPVQLASPGLETVVFADSNVTLETVGLIIEQNPKLKEVRWYHCPNLDSSRETLSTQHPAIKFTNLLEERPMNDVDLRD